MKRKLFALSLALILVLSLFGCTQDPDPTEPSGSGPVSTDPSPATDPTHLQQEEEFNLSVDANVFGRNPENAVPGIYQATLPEINQEKVEAFLESIGDPMDSVVSDDFSGDGTWFYTVETQSSGNVGVMYQTNTMERSFYSLSYSAERMRWYSSPVRTYGYERETRLMYDNAALYLEPRPIAFATKEEADATARSYLKLLGIEDVQLVETLYLDHETLAKEERTEEAIEQMTGKGGEPVFKDSWTEDDDAYYFTYEIEVDGITLLPREGSDWYQSGVSYATSSIEVILDKEGLISLTVSNPWIVQGEPEAVEGILTAEQALKKAKEVLLEAIAPYDQVIREVSLRYYYHRDQDVYTLRPCWFISVLGVDVPNMFMGTEMGPPENRLTYVVLDAVTGKPLVS